MTDCCHLNTTEALNKMTQSSQTSDSLSWYCDQKEVILTSQNIWEEFIWSFGFYEDLISSLAFHNYLNVHALYISFQHHNINK